MRERRNVTVGESQMQKDGLVASGGWNGRGTLGGQANALQIGYRQSPV